MSIFIFIFSPDGSVDSIPNGLPSFRLRNRARASTLTDRKGAANVAGAWRGGRQSLLLSAP